MKKITHRLIALWAVLTLLAAAVPLSLASEPAWDGKTTQAVAPDADGVYAVSTPSQLAWLAGQINQAGGQTAFNVILTADIDLNNQPWTPIGGYDYGNDYVGRFDGQGHKITGLYIHSAAPRQGLFGSVGEAGTVCNLTVEGAVSSSSPFVGGVVGWNKGTISRCVNRASVSGTAPKAGNASKVGGIAGQNSNDILNCRNSGRVTALKQTGGITGYQTDGRVAGCVNDGDVTVGHVTDNTNVGGIVGQLDKGGLYNCVNAGAVVSNSQQAYGNFYVGGIVGQCSGSKAKTAFNNLNTGAVSYTNPITENNPNGCNNFGYLYAHAPASLTAADSYYLSDEPSEAPQAMTTQQMKAPGFVSLLNQNDGSSYGAPVKPVEDDMRYAAVPGGYPLPSWVLESDEPVAVPVTAVSITGTAQAGETLTAIAVGENGEAATQPSYQWQVSQDGGASYTNIDGATGAAFSIPDDLSYVGSILRVAATGTEASFAVSQPTNAIDRSDVQKVAEALDALTLDIPAAIKEGGVLSLPTSGLYAATVTWKSSRADVISDNGAVTLPTSGIVSVTLTATVLCGEAKDTKDFTFAVYSAQAISDQDYVEAAVRALSDGYYKLVPTFGADTNAVTMLKAALDSRGYGDAQVSIGSSDDEYIAKDGSITYFYADPNGSSMLWFATSPVTFVVSKGAAWTEYGVNAVLHWDGDKARDVLDREIVGKVDDDAVRGENASLNAVESDLILPKVVDGKKWSLISWESSNPKVLSVDGSGQVTAETLFNPYIGRVKRGLEDQTVTLTATFSFQYASSGEPAISASKSFKVLVKALESTDLRDQMETALKDHYTVDKLTAMQTGDPIDPQAVTDDIQLLIPSHTGVPQYDQYTFSVTSDADSAVISGYRVNVYRPLPGEADKRVNLSVTMRHKLVDVAVTTRLSLTIKPLTQAEIDRETALMEAAKAAYFDGLNRGANVDAKQITASLSAFQEAVWNDGTLTWHYTRDELTGGGIVPVSIDESHPSEQWDRFHSSNAAVLSHESLILTQPAYSQDVTITSCLTSATYEKYAVRYPNNAAFQKLYRQPVSATVTVIGSKGGQPTPPEKINGTFTLTGDTPHGPDEHVFYPTWIDGAAFSVEEGTTVMDVFRQMLDENGYTYTGGAYVSAITTPDGQTLKAGAGGANSGWMYAVNGKLGSVYADAYVLKDGDRVLWFYTDDFMSDGRVDGDEITPDPSVPLPDYTAQWGGFRGNNGGLTASLTPRTAAQSKLKWAATLKEADDFMTAVSEPLVIGEHVYIAVGTHLVVLDKDGRVTAKGALAGAIGYTCRPLYSSGRVLVPLADGSLQALAADSLKTVWLTNAPAPYESVDGPLSHQALTTLTGDGDRLYMGTACADWVSSYYGVYRCIDAATGRVIWEYVNEKAGYYWSGAARIGAALLIAGDDGILTSLDAENGAVIDTANLGAPVRSTLATSGNTLLAVTTDGGLHTLTVTDGRLSGHKSVAFAASSTSSPTVYDGRVYVGGVLSEADDYAGLLVVIDLDTLAIIQKVTAPGDVKSAPLVATGYDGTVYAYFTANAEPGAVYVLTSGDPATTAAVLYTPAEENWNYCMASVVADAAGVLYYVNDSGKLFAIANTGADVEKPSNPTDPKPAPTPSASTTGTTTQPEGDGQATGPNPGTGDGSLPALAGTALLLMAGAMLLFGRRPTK